MITPYEVVYLVAFYGGWTLVFFVVYPSIDVSKQVSSHHKVYGIIVCGACIVSWILVKRLSPGEITHETVAQFNHYNPPSPTTTLDNNTHSTHHSTAAAESSLLIPRSKFHRGRYIPRFDHHCYILNRPIGECNYRYFLTLVLFHTGMCWYGTTIVFRLVWETVQRTHIGMSLVTKPLTLATLLPRWIVMLFQDVLGTVLAMMLGVLAVALTTFLTFHMYLIVTNTTTFEFFQRRKMRTTQRAQSKFRNANIVSDARQQRSSDEESPTRTTWTNVNSGASSPADQEHASTNTVNIHRSNNYSRGLLSNIGEFLYPRCYRTARGRKLD